MLGSINCLYIIVYIQYGSWYLEKMRKFFNEHPEVHKHVQGCRKLVVKTNVRYFKTVATDMKLEKSI